MSTTTDCDDCTGGANLVFEVNPDPNVATIVRIDNRVIIPQRVLPADICINALRNWDVTTVTTLPQGAPGPGVATPLAWVDGECEIEAWLPPCPQFLTYDPGSAADPGPVDLVNFPVGTTVFYALNTTSNCADKLWDCDGAQWVDICGGAPAVGPTADLVCYDVTTWGAPNWSFDNVTGLWDVLGINRITEGCAAGGRTSVFPDTPNTEVTTGYDSYGGTGPTGGWATVVGWQAWGSVDGTAAGFIEYVPNSLPPVAGSANGGARASFRTNFGILPGAAAGPLRYTLDHVDPGNSGTMRLAAWDSVSNTLMPITANAGVGTVATTPGVGGGDHLYIPPTPTPFSIDFTVTPPGTVDPANVYLILFNWGNSSSAERVDNIQMEYQPIAGGCCNDWTGVNNLVAYLNSHDPNGSGWSVDPDSVGNPNLICRTVAVGVGAQYGTLNGCFTPPISPTVTTI